MAHFKPDLTDDLININMEQSIPISQALLIGNSRAASPTDNKCIGGSSLAKVSRPFKAYPHDPLAFAASFPSDAQSANKYNEFRNQMILQIYKANGGQPTISNPKMRRNNGGPTPTTSQSAGHHFDNADTFSNTTCSSADSTNSSPTKTSSSSSRAAVASPPSDQPNLALQPDDNEEQCRGDRDPAYYERRRKNNAAAKKSRDRRRIKEDEIAIRAAFLERENMELKLELAAAQKQMAMFGMSRTC